MRSFIYSPFHFYPRHWHNVSLNELWLRHHQASGTTAVRTKTPGSHEYEISVHTGIFGDSGTTANVAMVICGDDEESEVLAVVRGNGQGCSFGRASVRTFSVKLPLSLGRLSYIRLWHDNSGPSPAWFLRQVVIRHVASDKKSFFMCNRWLAVDKDDGRIDRRLLVSDPKKLSGFNNQFHSRAARGLGDGHLWMSVYTRPPNSPFTRVQRLTCCLSLLLCAMVANAMFYETNLQQGSMEVVFGPIKFSWIEIIIGVQSSLVVVPVNVLIIQIFRNVGPKKKRKTKYVPGVNRGKASRCRLPHWTVYVAYALAFLSILGSGFVTILYSMAWGKEKSNKWLLSVIISLVQDIFVFQPLKIFAVAILLSLLSRKLPDEEHSPEDLNHETHSTLPLSSFWIPAVAIRMYYQ